MAYTALYRNYRPTKFEDMVGQEHITKTLKNQIMAGRVGHAYLFNGGRGTGKTTSAKILARAVNCLNPQNGEPCNECEICKEILNGSLTDVVEMDAASNNGVDDIRSIREEINFLPTKAKYRIYIIDEVHMLSIGAFNALLKTLEEPPEHVKFILATTEPQKLPVTILSRCQRFDFKKISDHDIVKRLKFICDDSKIDIDEDALGIIATLSEGHMRDAISILERCSQEGNGKISVDDVKELAGIPKITYIYNISKAVLEFNETEALRVVNEVIEDGKDLYNFLWEIIKYFKDILVFKATGKLNLYSKEELEKIKELAEGFEKERLLNIIYLLSDLENDLKWASQKNILFEVGIIKICRKEEVVSGDLEKRILNLENKISNLKSNPVQNITKNEIPLGNPVKRELNSPKEEKKLNIFGDANSSWKAVMESLKKNGKLRLYTALINTRVNEINDLIWEIEFPNGISSFNEKILNDNLNQKELIMQIFKATGKEVHLKYKDLKSQGGSNQKGNNDINNLGIDINILD